jgi:hypothetical protein
VKSVSRLLGIALGVLLAAWPAFAQESGFAFSNFADTTGLHVRGDAAQLGNVLRLTPSSLFQAVGGISHVAKQPVAGGFETRFQFQSTAPAGAPDCLGKIGADGLAFVIEGGDSFVLGDAGGGLGYAGVANSLAVEFDAYCNSDLNDPNGNHVSVHTLGLQPNSASHSASLGDTGTGLNTNMSDGAVHTVRITYASGALKVFLDDLGTPVLQVAVDLASVLSLTQGQAWVGVTSATGEGTENHDLLSWSFAPTSTAPPTTLVAAILPASRSVLVGTTATAFATLINSGTSAASACALAPATSLPASFTYQTTDPATNQIVGTPNTPVAIPAGAAQSFVFGLTPTDVIAPTDLAFSFTCANIAPVVPIVGVNTLLFSASATPVPDIIALAATLSNDGIVRIPGATGTGVFAVATVNVGASGLITASADTGTGVLPVTVSLCQTTPATGACMAPPSATVTTTINGSETPTFGIFVTGAGVVPFDPAVNRIFVRFKDAGGLTRGSTSVAVQTQ